MSYWELYNKRINRFGDNPQDRIQTQREKVFEGLLKNSVYLTSFIYDGEEHPGLLRRFKENETDNFGYFLTRTSLVMPTGTILDITDMHNVQKQWLIVWLESIQASGYNRYIVINMTHSLTWLVDQTSHTAPCHLFNRSRLILYDEARTKFGRSTYMENNALYSMIMPAVPEFAKHQFFDMGEDHFHVANLDRQTTEGIYYVSVDPIYQVDHTPAPIQPDGDTSDDYAWITGGMG